MSKENDYSKIVSRDGYYTLPVSWEMYSTIQALQQAYRLE